MLVSMGTLSLCVLGNVRRRVDILILGLMTMIVSLSMRFRGISFFLRRSRRGFLLILMRVGRKETESMLVVLEFGRTTSIYPHNMDHERSMLFHVNNTSKAYIKSFLPRCIAAHMYHFAPGHLGRYRGTYPRCRTKAPMDGRISGIHCLINCPFNPRKRMAFIQRINLVILVVGAGPD